MPDLPRPEPKSDFVCDCEEWMRSACVGEPYYKEHEGKRYCLLHFPGKEKSQEFKVVFQRKLDNGDFNFRGVWFPDEVSFTTFDFNGEANFDQATFSGEADFSNAIFNGAADFLVATFNEKANFSSVTFKARANFHNTIFNSNAYFYEATFNGTANFSSATFKGVAHFLNTGFNAEASFFSATFSQGNYPNATFKAGVNFINSTFTVMANFNMTTFRGAIADFSRATFVSEAYFSGSTFSAAADFTGVRLDAGVDFSRTTFADYVRLEWKRDESSSIDKSWLDLQFARIENPDHVSFHSVSLRPHWFVNVDASKFDFTNVGWPKLTKVDSNRRSIKKEIESLRNKKVDYPHRLLSIACWQLATNAEENHRYPEASGFRYIAMDANRLEHWRGFAFWRLSWWYWLASGYGERILRATVVLIGILLLTAAIYTQVGFLRSEPRLASESRAEATKLEDTITRLNLTRALIYSAEVMAFQKPEPKPATTAAHSVVLLETILGPVQAALLLLAIRRKFMR